MTTDTAAIENVAIDSLILDDDSIQIRTALNRETVERYGDSLEYLPPIDVYRVIVDETPEETEARGATVGVKVEKLYVADGFHRVAAFRSMGKDKIPARIHTGTLEDAEEFAAVANATSGRALTMFERNAAIRRIRRLHKSMSQSDIASRLSLSQPTVSRILRIDKARSDFPVLADVADATIQEILQANKEDVSALADAASAHDWTRAQTRTAVANLKDQRIEKADRGRILRGEIEPIANIKRDGSYETRPLGEPVEEPEDEDVWGPVRMALAWLADAEATEIVVSLDPDIIGAAADKLTEARDIIDERDAGERRGTDSEDDSSSDSSS